jgi:hypothetical protein
MHLSSSPYVLYAVPICLTDFITRMIFGEYR